MMKKEEVEQKLFDNGWVKLNGMLENCIGNGVRRTIFYTTREDFDRDDNLYTLGIVFECYMVLPKEFIGEFIAIAKNTTKRLLNYNDIIRILEILDIDYENKDVKLLLKYYTNDIYGIEIDGVEGMFMIAPYIETSITSNSTSSS